MGEKSTWMDDQCSNGECAQDVVYYHLSDEEKFTVAILNDRIEINPAICHGKPVVRGTRVMVSQIFGALAGGDSVDDVLDDYPSLSAEDISAVFAFAGALSQFEDIPYAERAATT